MKADPLGATRLPGPPSPPSGPDATIGLWLSRIWEAEPAAVLSTGRLWEDVWLRQFGLSLEAVTTWFGDRITVCPVERFTEDLGNELLLLGCTESSRVYLAFWRGGFVAVKQNPQPGEFQTLSALRHPGIVRCLGKTGEGLVMQPLLGGSLADHLRREGRFSQTRCKLYCLEILDSLQYIHSKGHIYRDLKLENVVLDSTGHAKLVDFGLCGPYSPANRMCGSLPYMAPETLFQKQTTTLSDVYSLGVLLFQMLTGLSPFRGSEEEIIEQKDRFDLELPAFIGRQVA